MATATTAAPIVEPTDEDMLARWQRHRVAIAARIDAIGDEIRSAVDAAAEARRTAMLADASDSRAAEAVGQLIGRQRALEAERDELLERLAVAQKEERRLDLIVSQTRVDEYVASFAPRAFELIAAATTTDAAIVEAVASLRAATVRRWEIDETRRLLGVELEAARLEHTRQGFDVPPARLPEHPPFDARALIPAAAGDRYIVTV